MTRYRALMLTCVLMAHPVAAFAQAAPMPPAQTAPPAPVLPPPAPAPVVPRPRSAGAEAGGKPEPAPPAPEIQGLVEMLKGATQREVGLSIRVARAEQEVAKQQEQIDTLQAAALACKPVAPAASATPAATAPP